MATTDYPRLWIIVFGFAFALGAPAVAALPGEVLTPESRGQGFGVWNTVYYIGMALVPAAAGYIVDASGGATGALWFSAALWLAVIPALRYFGG